MASDMQSTEMTSGQPIRVKSDKIYSFGKGVLWGGAGDGGAIQEVKRRLDGTDSASLRKHADVRSLFEQITFEVNKPRHHRFLEMKLGAPGQVSPSTMGQALLAQYDEGQCRIVEFAVDGASTNYDESGYQAIGSGDIFARSSLHGYETCNLNLDQAKILAYMTVQKAIDIAAYGLGYPIDVWTLSRKGESPVVQRVSDQDKRVLADATKTIWQAQIEVFADLSQEKSGQQSRPTTR
jgi:20S proteasome alpha/beta subunit